VGYVSSWSAYSSFVKERGEAEGQRLLAGFRARVLAGLKAAGGGAAATGGVAEGEQAVTLVTPIALVLARGPMPLPEH
jgi:hypothetical protein